MQNANDLNIKLDHLLGGSGFCVGLGRSTEFKTECLTAGLIPLSLSSLPDLRARLRSLPCLDNKAEHLKSSCAHFLLPHMHPTWHFREASWGS